MKLVSILPSANDASYTCSNAHLEVKNIAKTNIIEMYAFLHGSIPDGKSLVYYTQPGVEGEIFGMHTAYTALEKGRTCAFVDAYNPLIVSTIMDLCGERETTEAVKLWNKMAMQYGHILVYNFTAWPYSQETLDLIKKDLFNAVIFVGDVEGSTISRQYFGILKSDWMYKWGNQATKY